MQISKFLIKDIDGCKNNPETSVTTKIGEYIPTDFSMSTISSFKDKKIKHGVYRDKDSMEKFGVCLKKHAGRR